MNDSNMKFETTFNDKLSLPEKLARNLPNEALIIILFSDTYIKTVNIPTYQLPYIVWGVIIAVFLITLFIKYYWTGFATTQLPKDKSWKLKYSLLSAITYLIEHGDTRLAELQSKLNFTSYPHIKPHLDTLEKGRFIELIRDDQDKRIVVAHMKRWIDTLFFVEEES